MDYHTWAEEKEAREMAERQRNNALAELATYKADHKKLSKLVGQLVAERGGLRGALASFVADEELRARSGEPRFSTPGWLAKMAMAKEALAKVPGDFDAWPILAELKRFTASIAQARDEGEEIQDWLITCEDLAIAAIARAEGRAS